MTRRLSWCLLACLVGPAFLWHAPLPSFAGPTVDRLDRFRELARTRLAAADLVGGEQARGLYRQMYELLDEEIVESLHTGGVFASEGFLRDRLDAFNETWGGVALHLIRAGAVVVAAVRLGDIAEGNSSVRVYGGRRGEATLLGTIQRGGDPTLYPMPPAARGTPQFVVVWEAAPSARGTTPVRIDLVQQEGDAVRTAWSTVELLGGDLQTWSYSVRGSEIRLRYELQYPGWVPGCEGQTEQEDLFRYVPARRTFRLVRRRLHAGWHRDFHAAVARFFTALRADDGRALEDLVPDARIRTGLPKGLEPEPACDAPDGSPPSMVSVAAALRVERRPWALTFRRTRSAWRLVGAGPVIE